MGFDIRGAGIQRVGAVARYRDIDLGFLNG